MAKTKTSKKQQQHHNDYKISEKQIQSIIKDCCLKFFVRPEELSDESRKKDLVVCRAVICKILNSMGRSLEEIGERFGYRDHSTMSNCLKIIENILAADNDKYKGVVYELLCKHVDNEQYLRDAINYHLAQAAYYSEKAHTKVNCEVKPKKTK